MLGSLQKLGSGLLRQAAIAAVVSSAVLHAQPRAPMPGPSGPAEQATQALVFLRGEHPVFLRLTVLLDGQELKAARDERIRKVFEELDKNADQVIDQAERDAQPQGLRKLGVREKWPAMLPTLDNNPQDGNVSDRELMSFALNLFGPPVRLAPRAKSSRRSGQAVELFDLLDQNQDQSLDGTEFAAVSRRLHKLDADGDEAFSVIEVEPFRNPFGARRVVATGTPEDSPWAMVENAAALLMKRFDQQAPKGVLSAEELGVSASQFKFGDSDHDGGLSLEELGTWLPKMAPDYLLTVNLPQRKAGQANLTWASASQPPPPSNPRQRARPAKSMETQMSGQPLQLQVSASRSSQADNLTFYKLQFRRSDQDKNKYLNQTEFASMSIPGATFELLDADGNGEIYENELQDFLTLESLVDQGHVMVTYDNNEVSLFSLLDVDKDNRLSPRECLQAASAWQSYDHNHDQKLERQELSGKLRLTVELVKPRLFQDAAMTGNMMTGEPIINEKAGGPVWFRGMDRNRDGDISRREFPGSEDAFKKWDRNGDGLISLAEAE